MIVQRKQMGKFGRYVPLASFTLFFVLGCLAQPASAQDLPVSVHSKILTAWSQARENWDVNAQFLGLDLERDNAQQGYESDYVFGSNKGLYHIKHGPKGNSAGTSTHPYYVAGAITSKVIDPAKAVSIAYSHGMKGKVLTAQLEVWVEQQQNTLNPNEVSFETRLEVWRIVPDNDPNTADPNDPNMKNYYVDALTGDYYDMAHLNAPEVYRNSQAYGNAAFNELLEYYHSRFRSH